MHIVSQRRDVWKVVLARRVVRHKHLRFWQALKFDLSEKALIWRQYRVKYVS